MEARAGVRDTGTEGRQGWRWVLETVLTVQRTRRTDRESRADVQVTFTYDSRRREDADQSFRGERQARGSPGPMLRSSLAKPVGPG